MRYECASTCGCIHHSAWLGHGAGKTIATHWIVYAQHPGAARSSCADVEPTSRANANEFIWRGRPSGSCRGRATRREHPGRPAHGRPNRLGRHARRAISARVQASALRWAALELLLPLVRSQVPRTLPGRLLRRAPRAGLSTLSHPALSSAKALCAGGFYPTQRSYQRQG